MNSAVLAYHARRRAGIARRNHSVVDFVSNIGQSEPTVRVIVQAGPDDNADLAALRAGLLATPAYSSPKFFYDVQGSALFTAICALDEDYPTRTEAAIFEQHRAAIAHALPAAAQWIDLGCGDCAKSRGWFAAVRPARFVGVDISEVWLRSSLSALAEEFAEESADIEFVGAVTDFTRPFDLHALLAECPDAQPVFFYPGSSIGNFTPDQALAFLVAIREHVVAHASGGGRLLIGIDLVKDATIMEAAYDDAIGVTAAFNRNVLRVANRLLDADFDPHAFDHRAVFDAGHSRVEMHLVARHAHDVRVGNTVRRFAAGEPIVTEYSYKYTPQKFTELLIAAGFSAHGGPRLWTDAREWFGVFLAEPA